MKMINHPLWACPLFNCNIVSAVFCQTFLFEYPVISFKILSQVKCNIFLSKPILIFSISAGGVMILSPSLKPLIQVVLFHLSLTSPIHSARKTRKLFFPHEFSCIHSFRLVLQMNVLPYFSGSCFFLNPEYLGIWHGYETPRAGVGSDNDHFLDNCSKEIYSQYLKKC